METCKNADEIYYCFIIFRFLYFFFIEMNPIFMYCSLCWELVRIRIDWSNVWGFLVSRSFWKKFEFIVFTVETPPLYNNKIPSGSFRTLVHTHTNTFTHRRIFFILPSSFKLFRRTNSYRIFKYYFWFLIIIF